MSRSRYSPGSRRDHGWLDLREHNAAAHNRADLPEALAEYAHHARWSTAPEFRTRLDYTDPEAEVLAIAAAKLAHHRGRRRSVHYRSQRASHRADASNNKGGRLEPPDPRVVVRSTFPTTTVVLYPRSISYLDSIDD